MASHRLWSHGYAGRDNDGQECLPRSCPQYIGRRLSNARRSAQVLPEEVRSVIEHKVDLSGTCLLHQDSSLLPEAAGRSTEEWSLCIDADWSLLSDMRQ